MKLPVGSIERAAAKSDLEYEIVKAADNWELQRARLRDLEDANLSEKSFMKFIHAADKLAATVRKWRKL